MSGDTAGQGGSSRPKARFSIKSFSRSTRRSATRSALLAQEDGKKQQEQQQREQQKNDVALDLPPSHQLRTRNVQRKRHSVYLPSTFLGNRDIDFEHGVGIDTVNENLNLNVNVNVNDNEPTSERSYSPLHSTKASAMRNYTVLRSRSTSSLTEYSESKSLLAGETTLDSDAMLIDMDMHSNMLQTPSRSNSPLKPNFANTLNDAFSNYNTQLTSLHSPAPTTANSAFTTSISNTTDDSTTNSPSINSPVKSTHPLRKLTISSPNQKSISTFPQQLTPTTPVSLQPQLHIYIPNHSNLCQEVSHVSICTFIGVKNCQPFSDLVDPDLLTINSNSIFSATHSDPPPKRRTPLIFF